MTFWQVVFIAVGVNVLLSFGRWLVLRCIDPRWTP